MLLALIAPLTACDDDDPLMTEDAEQLHDSAMSADEGSTQDAAVRIDEGEAQDAAARVDQSITVEDLGALDAQAQDAAIVLDLSPPFDGASPVDAAPVEPLCGSGPQMASIRFETTIAPTGDDGWLEYRLDGVLETVMQIDGRPDAKALILRHGDGTQSRVTIQLPLDPPLPLEEGVAYMVMLREVTAFEGPARGLVINRLDEVDRPLLTLVLEPGSMGNVFQEHDPALGPLFVEQLENPGCPPRPDDEYCGSGQLFGDLLRFNLSTGAGVAQVELAEGLSGELEFFGRRYEVQNLRSHRLDDPMCADAPGRSTGYVLKMRP